jgi:hypothetical protein
MFAQEVGARKTSGTLCLSVHRSPRNCIEGAHVREPKTRDREVSMRRQSAALALVAVVVLSAGCGGVNSHTEARRASLVGPTVAATATTSARSTAYLDVGAVQVRMTWDSGQDVLLPAPPDTHPVVSAAAAYAVIANDHPSATKPKVMFGLFSSTTPSRLGPTGQEPIYVRRPMWVIWWHHIEVVPRFGPAPMPGATSPPPRPVQEDVLITVDATSGKEQFAETFGD